MQRVAFLVAIGLVLGQSGPVQAAQDGWKPIVSGGMTVSMPCTAEWETKTQEIPEEASIVTAHLLACKTADSFYLLTWAEVETRNQFDGMTALRASRDSMLKEAGGGQVLTSSDIVHDGLKGIDFTANLRGALLLSSRGVFHQKRMYTITVGTPLNQDRSADIKRFLTSLKIAR